MTAEPPLFRCRLPQTVSPCAATIGQERYPSDNVIQSIGTEPMKPFLLSVTVVLLAV